MIRNTKRMRLVATLLAVASMCIISDRSFVRAMSPPGSPATTAVHTSKNDDDSSEDLALFRAMHSSILNRRESGAFLAALDQSGGSTPKALAAYGMGPEEGNYEIGTER